MSAHHWCRSLTLSAGALIGLWMAAPQATGHESEQLLAEVRAAWAKREQAAQNLTAKWHQEELMTKGGISRIAPDFAKGEVMPPQDTKLSGRGELYFAGSKCRAALEWPVWGFGDKQFNRSAMDAALTNGVLKTRTWTTRGPTSKLSATPTGTMSKEDWNSWGAGSAWPITLIYRGTTVQGQQANIDIYTRARRIQSNTGPGIELVQERTERRGEARLLVDPARDYFPTRSESFDRDGKIQGRFVIRSRKDDRFGWVPEAWEVTKFQDAQLIRTVSCRLDELVIGGPISEEVFDITYVPGTYVSDTSGDKPRNLIIREGKGPREVLPEEQGASYQRLIETEAGDLVPGRRPSVLTRYVWAVASGSVVLIVMVFLARRARRARRAQRTQP